MAEKEAAAFTLLALALDDHEKRKRGPTRKWIQRREEEGLYANLVQEPMVEDTRTYREMMRMDYDYFKHILQLIEPYITPQNSDFFHANHIHSNKNIRMRPKTFECVINDSK